MEPGLTGVPESCMALSRTGWDPRQRCRATRRVRTHLHSKPQGRRPQGAGGSPRGPGRAPSQLAAGGRPGPGRGLIRALLSISSRSSHHPLSHPSPCASETVVTWEGLSRLKLCSDWASRSKFKCILLPRPGDAVRIRVHFAMLSVVRFCFLVQSHVLVLPCQLPTCRGRGRGAARGSPAPGQGCGWGGFVFPLSTKPWRMDGAQGTQRVAVLTPKDADPVFLKVG